MNSANKFKNVSDYSKYLTNKYKCLTPCKNASVLIDRSVMQKACGKFSNYARCYTKCTEGGNKSW